MGDQLYAYRGQYSSAYGDDDWTDRTYGGSGDKACRTIIYDGDGGRRTVVGCDPGDYFDTKTTYVVEEEVKERIRPAADYRPYGSPAPAPVLKKAAEQYVAPPRIGSTYVEKCGRRPSSPAGYVDRGRRPQEVDEFLTGVQIEASRLPPLHSTGPAHGGGGYGMNSAKSEDQYRPYSKPHHEYQNYRNGGAYSSDDDDYDSERDDDCDDDDYGSERDDDDRYYYKPKLTTTKPIRPELSGHKAYGGAVGVGKLGMPTSNIDEAIDCLKGSTAGANYGAKPYELAPDREPVKPYGSGYNSGYGSDASKPYNWNKYVQQTIPEAVKPYGSEVVKPCGTAAKYGGSTATTATTTTTVIDCYEAARKYKGLVIRT